MKIVAKSDIGEEAVIMYQQWNPVLVTIAIMAGAKDFVIKLFRKERGFEAIGKVLQ